MNFRERTQVLGIIIFLCCIPFRTDTTNLFLQSCIRYNSSLRPKLCQMSSCSKAGAHQFLLGIFQYFCKLCLYYGFITKLALQFKFSLQRFLVVCGVPSKDAVLRSQSTKRRVKYSSLITVEYVHISIHFVRLRN